MKRQTGLVVFGVAFVTAVIAQPFRLVKVNGGSMSPTYEEGNLVLTSRSASDFHHGDVVVFNHDGETFVKRIAFLPGDRIFEFEFKGNWVAPGNDFMYAVAKRDHYPHRLRPIPDGQLYVLGDNFEQSIDSRTFGTIPIASVIGKVTSEPMPELIHGFAGAREVDESSSHVVTRVAAIYGRDENQAKLYLARMDQRASRRSHSN